YVNKYSTLIDTKVEDQNVEVSPEFNYDPGSTYYYSSNGFTNTLNATGPSRLLRGQYVPSESKSVSDQTSSYYSDSSGFSGTLSQYQSGSNSTPAESRTEKTTGSVSYRWSYTCTKASTGSPYWGAGTRKDNIPESKSYNSGGFSGTLYVGTVT